MWRFIKYLLEIAHLLYKLLENESELYFDDVCQIAFGELKKKLISAPIIIAQDWGERAFEAMRDASGVALGLVLIKGMRRYLILFTM